MEFISSHDKEVVSHTLKQLTAACQLIEEWNINVKSSDDYLLSSEGVQKMAATCMLIESIGEGVKKIDRHIPNFLTDNAPDIAWKELKGLRDHIAHGYFNLDAEIIYDVAINEIPLLKITLQTLSLKILAQ